MEQRYLGSIFGLAVGDCLGVAVEFCPRGSFEPVTEMLGGGPFGLAPGMWTDDTSMMLCLAQSLIECGGFDAKDQMERYVRWYKEGYMSSTGHCFSIGNTCEGAIERFLRTGEPYAGSSDPRTAGNGSLMRLAPIPLYFAMDAEAVTLYAGESSRMTHAAVEAVDSCRYFSGVIRRALMGESKENILLGESSSFTEGVQRIVDGSYKIKNVEEIRGSGYVLESMEAALWAFYHTHTFQEGVLAAVNLGDDADTTAAIFGQLAGAFYGFDEIPLKWVEKVSQPFLFRQIAVELMRRHV